MAKYGTKAKSKVKSAMHRLKRGELKSGRSGKKVTSRKQAIAIGLSQARKAGGKVPVNPNRPTTGAQKKAASSTRKKATSSTRTTAKRTAPKRKTASRKTTARRAKTTRSRA